MRRNAQRGRISYFTRTPTPTRRVIFPLVPAAMLRWWRAQSISFALAGGSSRFLPCANCALVGWCGDLRFFRTWPDHAAAWARWSDASANALALVCSWNAVETFEWQCVIYHSRTHLKAPAISTARRNRTGKFLHHTWCSSEYFWYDDMGRFRIVSESWMNSPFAEVKGWGKCRCMALVEKLTCPWLCDHFLVFPTDFSFAFHLIGELTKFYFKFWKHSTMLNSIFSL